MLVELRITDYALIERVTLSLAPGFNVLTGETGAGKSIVVGALGLLLGERASSDVVRTGRDRAIVEGTFEVRGRADLAAALDAHGLDADGVAENGGTVTLRREVAASGRARAWVNGSAVTATVLAEIGRRLVDLHGQHEAQTLLDEASQRDILDAFAGAHAQAVRVREAHGALVAARRDRETLATRRAEAIKRADWLRHVAAEIEGAAPVDGEDERLDDEAKRLEHADELRLLAAQSAALLDGDDDGALTQLAAARKALERLARLDPGHAALAERLADATAALAELARDLDGYAESVDLDPARLAAVQRRREVLYGLMQKHGPTLADVLRTGREVRAELDLVDAAGFDVATLEARERAAQAALVSAARALSATRTGAASRLATAVSAHLPALGMADGAFAVRLEPRAVPVADGAETVEFRVRLNAGHDDRPLARVASGGELARVMLALKSVLADVDGMPTLVFDEVDAGIGGAVGLRVGDAMRALAATHQVFAITHLPQIAARAHHHVQVAKAPKGGVTTTDVVAVEGDAREREIARMLGGDGDSDVGRAHARELLAGAADRAADRAVSGSRVTGARRAASPNTSATAARRGRPSGDSSR
jgi:DNA repair protein RecN (Recombination protein N)